MRFLWILFLLINLSVFGQTKIFRGDRVNPNDLAYIISNQKIQRMSSSLWGNDLYIIRANKVYDAAFSSRCLYTIEGNKIYNGDSDSIFDLLYEYENGKLYQVSNSSLKRVVFTLYNNQVFIGESTSTFDCIFSVQIDNQVNNSELLLLLCLAPF